MSQRFFYVVLVINDGDATNTHTMTTPRKIRISHRIHLLIDHSDSATPAIVEAGRYTSTYDCVMNSGEIYDTIALSDSEMETLAKYRDAVEEAYDIAREGDPEYN